MRLSADNWHPTGSQLEMRTFEEYTGVGQVMFHYRVADEDQEMLFYK